MVAMSDYDEFHKTAKRHLLSNVLGPNAQGAIELDWRDFFPYLKWIPNRGFEKGLEQIIPVRPDSRAEKTYCFGIAINLYGCNMEKEVWENPEEWNPERFLYPVDLYKTMAFGGGKRVCARALEAMLISCVAIARFVQEFEWKLEGEEDDVDTLGLTGHKRNPINAFLKSRK
ncbi:hypothetical protein RJ639_044563 [Escallonia herrerae]|uniref:Cytochrome P450 n=1 Tax=Escallonia herrerae TaxID=1293975 RepID=A0AA89B2H2_9ASTE|nr:hypothetical protein RJ639_044563 [Escallonia herrerae]